LNEGKFLNAEMVTTPNESKYLMLMYRKQLEERRRITTTVLARSFKVNPATVTEILQKLAQKKLVKYTRYYGAELTEKGIAEAQKLLRKHRILEFLLVKFLKYNTEKACEEASTIDHYCSENLINAICRTYGHPERCPCNKVIFGDPTCRGQGQTKGTCIKSNGGYVNSLPSKSCNLSAVEELKNDGGDLDV
jgi:DtxR family Mn-dependent transcriptional regulator